MEANFLGIVLGSFLAVLGGIVGYEYQGFRQRRLHRALLTQLLRDETQQIIGILDRILQVYQQMNRVNALQLLELQNARTGYDRNRDWIIVLRGAQLRTDITNFYAREQLTRAYLQVLIANESNPQWLTFIPGEIARQIPSLVQLRQDGANIINQLI